MSGVTTTTSNNEPFVLWCRQCQQEQEIAAPVLLRELTTVTSFFRSTHEGHQTLIGSRAAVDKWKREQEPKRHSNRACLCVSPPFGNDPEFCGECHAAGCPQDTAGTPCRVTGEFVTPLQEDEL